MADLLECLIQIKGVAATPGRLAVRARAAASRGRAQEACDVAARLARADSRFGACLASMLAEDRPVLPALEPPPADVAGARGLSDWLDEFSRRRAEIVRALDRCSADDLARVGLEPSRGPMTVADLVALMLAHDTDQLGLLVAGTPAEG